MDTNIFKTYLANAAFKQFHPFLKLATSCAESQPCISYWAVYYCCDHGMQANNKTPSDEMTNFVKTMMVCLEKEKDAQRQLGDDDHQKAIVEKYGNQLFLKAEEEAELDVSPTTAIKLYLSAANVYQLTEYFLKDEQSKADNAKRIKYCKWKAVTIAKKAKEQPPEQPKDPSPEASDNENDNFSRIPQVPTNNDIPLGFNLPPDNPPHSAPVNPSFQAPMPPSSSSSYPSVAPVPAPRSSAPEMPIYEPSPIPEANFAQMSLTDSDIRKAELLCESALYAIKSNDLYNAVTGLQQSLQLIYKAARSNR